MLWKNNFWERVSTNSRRGSLRRQIDEISKLPGWGQASYFKTAMVVALEFWNTEER